LVVLSTRIESEGRRRRKRKKTPARELSYQH
jgi:hypothetical protein